MLPRQHKTVDHAMVGHTLGGKELPPEAHGIEYRAGFR